MDQLPQALVLEILSRLTDSADVARCKLTCKAFNHVSREVRSINLQCSLERYIRSRCSSSSSSTDSVSPITPFKKIFLDLVSSSPIVESVSIGAEKPLRDVSYDDVEDESDDLFLTDENFVKEWLPLVSRSLKSVSISDFWVQSCWRRSALLPLVSSYCQSLLQLDVKNAWLSVDGLNPMPTLTSLTLEFIRLDDEDLNELSKCFPSLEVLNLKGVGGLKDPKIHLLRLKTCHWTVSNAPSSLTLVTPNLTTFKLECIKPGSLVIEAPWLSNFHLALEMAGYFKVKEFSNLKTLRLESSYLDDLLSMFPFGKTVKNLTVDSRKCARPVANTKLTLGKLFTIFPNVSSLILLPGAWCELEACNSAEGWEVRSLGMKGLREICVYLLLVDPELALSSVCSVLDQCTSLFNASLLIHNDVVSNVSRSFISRCIARYPRVKWRWGMWKEGIKDTWISNGI